MQNSIRFYFSVASRYSYLASTQIGALGAQTGCPVEWIPVDGQELRQKAGNDQFNGAKLSGQYKSPYRERDLADWVDFYEIPYREPPDSNGELWWRDLGWEKVRQMSLAALAGQVSGANSDWFEGLFHLMFVGDRWPFDIPEILKLAERVGLDPREVQSRMEDPETSERLTENTRRALDEGVFGVPAFVWNGKMFFGNDRLVILERQIAKSREA